MDTKKHVVYDCRNYFSRFLKYEFRKSLNFDTFKEFESFENAVNNYSVIVFVIYSEDELIDFMRVYKRGIPLIVCTFNEKLFLTMRQIDEIYLLDTSKLKSEIIIEFKSYLKLASFSLIENIKNN